MIFFRSKPPKLCVDCRRLTDRMCASPYLVSVVTGAYVNPHVQRDYERLCGRRGKYWEPKQ